MLSALAIVFAQVATPTVRPALTPTRTPKPPTLDGQLNEEVWKEAPAADAFTQKFPDEGRPPTERTTIRVLYDDEAIYVGFENEQKRSPIVARMARRDREVEADWVSIALDTRAFGKTAFEFIVNAAGVLRDGIRSNDVMDQETGNRFSASWDENWDARTSIRDDGWSAEIRIPLRILRFSSRPIQTWGFEARRYTSARQEIDEWAFVPRNVASEVALYGQLRNMRLAPRSELELRPFALGRLRRSDRDAFTLDSGLAPSASGGLDLRWHITPDLTLDGTVNPDFTQVEGDELVLNLSNFEWYFPEKRPFFVEGAEIFESPAPLFYARSFQLLYTRRIGLRPPPPSLRPGAVFGEKLVTRPEASTILGATKLVGRIGGGWSVGAMSALTGENTVEVGDATGARHVRIADPAAAYQAVRVKHDFEGGRAHVGFLGTAVGRAETTRLHPTVAPEAGGPLTAICPNGQNVAPGARCSHDAYVGSADGLWRSQNGEIMASVQAVASVMKHGPPRTLRDGTVIGDGDAGWGAQATAAREGGSGLAWNVQYQHATRKLDFNDLGYMERQNQHYYYGNLEYRTFDHLWKTIETRSYAEVFGRYNLDGVKLNRRWLLDTQVRFENFWFTYLEFNYDEVRFDDREVGNGQPFERPGKPGMILQLVTDRRRTLFFDAIGVAQRLPDGANAEVKIRTIVRPHPQVELELTPTVTHTTGETRFAANGQLPNELVFGNLRASSFATTVRANYTITPRLAFQTFGQLYLAAGHYSDFRTFVGAGPTRDVIRVGALAPSAPPLENPDFLDVSLNVNVNVVLRWEYSIGSILYLVYNRMQTPASPSILEQPAALSFVPLGRAPAIDTLLLKWQLYFNL